MALQWLCINGFSMIGDDLRILNMTGSHSQTWMSPMAVTRPKQLANFLWHMALQWLRITGFSMKKDDLWILNMTVSNSQNLHNVRQRNSAAPMAHDPLINTLGLGNRLDFNQQAGGRCHLLPSVANRVEAPSLKRCLLRECLHRLSLGQNNWPIPYNKWLHHDYRWQDDLQL